MSTLIWLRVVDPVEGEGLEPDSHGVETTQEGLNVPKKGLFTGSKVDGTNLVGGRARAGLPPAVCNSVLANRIGSRYERFRQICQG